MNALRALSPIDLLGIALPALLIGASVWGIFSKHFLDNLLQRLAMCGMIVVCVVRISLVGERGFVDSSDIALYLVMLLYVVGVIFKIRSFSPNNHRHRKGDSAMKPSPK